MNLILLDDRDFIESDRVRLDGRRLRHIREVHRAVPGDELHVGAIGGKLGRALVERCDNETLEMRVTLDAEPPAPLPLRLILALPRPKVLNRTIAAAVSMGIREIEVINSWRVDKAYWKSPRLSPENLRLQSILGLEQAGDTILPTIRLHPLFSPFLRTKLPEMMVGRIKLLADPSGEAEFPRQISDPVLLAIGPEGGFIDREITAFRDQGFSVASFGPRILRVETALACLIGRMF
jgi:RsmE family RNA methyltransferase